MLKKIGVTPLGYDDIDYDAYGWADAKRFVPSKFDLVKIKTDTKTINGWYTGERWYAVRLRKKDDVLSWKKIKEIY